MNKPNNYDNTKVGFVPVELGGHLAVIKAVEEMTNKSGGDMIKVSIDFDTKDAQPNYFTEEYKNDTRSEKKWPNNAVMYVNVLDNEGKTSKSFKAFCGAYEDSNNKEVIFGNPNWGAQFKNAKVGVVYGEEESWYNDQIHVNRKIRNFCSYDKALSRPVPEIKKYKGDMGTQTNVLPSSNEFMTVPEGFDEGLPFN